MTATIKTSALVALGFALSTAAATAGPIIVPPMPEAGTFQLVPDQVAASKTEAARTWVKTKTKQTARWMGRQKQKLKQLAD